MNYVEDYYEEPIESEMVLNEFTTKIKDLLKKEINKDYDNIFNENNNLKTKNKELKNELSQIKKENIQLKNNFKNVEMFNILKGLIDEEKLSYILQFFNLQKTNIKIDGMDADKIPAWFKMLVSYYEDKEKLFKIMDMFDIKYPIWVKDFKMPYDYNEEEIDLFFNNLSERYICNGQIFGGNMGFFWESINKHKANAKNILTKNTSFSNYVPWQLFLKNPLLVTDKYFNMIIKSLDKNISNSHYFFAIQKYQTLSEEQAKQMYKYLPKGNLYDIHKSFIENNKDIIRNNPELAEIFIDKISDNQFSTFYYLNYPLKMQKEYIKNYSNGYETKLNLIKKINISKEEKIEFIKEIVEIELEKII